MSADLIAELRSAAKYAGLSLADRAADRIAELEAQLATPAPTAELLNEVADLLMERNWRGDLAEALRDLAAATPAPTAPSDAQDAARYRWIRDRAHNGFNLCGPESIGNFHTSQKLADGHATYYFGERLDAAIDAAIDAALTRLLR